MPKNKKPRPNQHTTLSLPERMVKQRQEQELLRRLEIDEERSDAAKTVLMIALVSANNTDGLGITRLVRLAKEIDANIREHYEAPELLDYHREKLYERLRQLGFMVKDGHLYGVWDSDTGKTVRHKDSVPVDFKPAPERGISLRRENDYLRAELSKALARIAEMEGANNAEN